VALFTESLPLRTIEEEDAITVVTFGMVYDAGGIVARRFFSEAGFTERIVTKELQSSFFPFWLVIELAPRESGAPVPVEASAIFLSLIRHEKSAGL